MEKIVGILKFNNNCNSYGLAKPNGAWQHPEGLAWYTFDRLNCGTTMQVKVGNKWVATRLEQDGQAWYLVGTNFYKDLEGIEARINY